MENENVDMAGGDAVNNGVGKKGKDYYFDSYSHYGIHEEMIKDEVRTGTYKQAILGNPHLFKDKIVLDVGCGTGILSLFCAQAGAKHVYAVDNSDIVDFAKDIIRKNGMEKSVTVIRGKMEEIDLPVDKVDIIVSEWMGYCLLYEAMLDTVLNARDRYLAVDGIILPDKCTMFLTGIEDRAYKKEKIDWWKSVYGFDMSYLREAAMIEPLVDMCNPRQVCMNDFVLAQLDIGKMKVEEKQFRVPFKLKAIRNDYLTALVLYFSVEFSPCKPNAQGVPLGFSTGPKDKYTHWKQTVFYIDKVLTIKNGETMEGEISCEEGGDEKRNLDLTIAVSFKGELDSFDGSRKYKMR